MSTESHPLLKANERVLWAGAPRPFRSVRLLSALVFGAGLALLAYGAAELRDLAAASSAFRGTAFEGFFLKPATLFTRPALTAALGLVLSSLLPIRLWSLAGTRYFLSERRAFEKRRGLLGTRYIAAGIAPAGTIASVQRGQTYALVFEVSTGVPDETQLMEFVGLPHADFEVALSHIQNVSSAKAFGDQKAER